MNAVTPTEEAPPHMQVVGLYQESGTHYVHLWCGGDTRTPQRQTMIVDTGSSTTAMACLPDCSPRRCGRLHHAAFSPEKSRTFRKVSHCDDCRLGTCVTNKEKEASECVWQTSYQEGSNWTAFEAIDQCYLGSWPSATQMQSKSAQIEGEKTDAVTAIDAMGLDPSRAALDFAFDLRFGCQTQLSGQFRTQTTAGIMGLDRSGTAASIWSQMFQQGKIPQPAFSLCLARATDTHSFAGALTLGGTDARLHTAGAPGDAMVFAAMNPEDRHIGFFSLQLRQLYLRFNGGNTPANGKTVPIRPVSEASFRKRRIVIDSGTTDTFFVQELKDPFLKAWSDTLGLPYSNDPIALSETALNSLPTLILQLKGDDASNAEVFSRVATAPHLAGSLDPDRPLDILVAIPPSHYMEYQEDIAMYVSGIYFENAEGSVIGSNVMLMHDVYFDVEHERVGWAKSSCDYAKLIAPFVPEDAALRVATPLVQTSDTTAVLDGAYLPWGLRLTGFCTSITCRLSMTAGLIVTFLVVLTLASRRGKRHRRRQRRQFAPPPLQRHGSRMVARSASHAVPLGPNKMAPTRTQSSSVMAFLMSSGANTSPASNNSDSDHLHIPSGVAEESHAPDFAGRSFRRGSLLRSRSREVTL